MNCLRRDNIYYKTGYICVSCKTRLLADEVYYSDGSCPYCGFSSKSTIVPYKKKAIKVRHINRSDWFKKFFKR